MHVRLLRRHSAHYGGDWAVIVPYRAQVELISQRLGAALGDTRHGDKIGTVDSFQGGERDLVVYGFTRSNSSGQVGFLNELRRINVAMTRARQQLVLVGDSTMAARSRHGGFGQLMTQLLKHVDAEGDRRGSLEFEELLRV